MGEYEYSHARYLGSPGTLHSWVGSNRLGNSTAHSADVSRDAATL
jgi:hypothetical protein